MIINTTSDPYWPPWPHSRLFFAGLSILVWLLALSEYLLIRFATELKHLSLFRFGVLDIGILLMSIFSPRISSLACILSLKFVKLFKVGSLSEHLSTPPSFSVTTTLSSTSSSSSISSYSDSRAQYQAQWIIAMCLNTDNDNVVKAKRGKDPALQRLLPAPHGQADGLVLVQGEPLLLGHHIHFDIGHPCR